jgi:hypothetical protein
LWLHLFYLSIICLLIAFVVQREQTQKVLNALEMSATETRLKSQAADIERLRGIELECSEMRKDMEEVASYLIDNYNKPIQ